MLQVDIMSISRETTLRWRPKLHWWLLNIALGNDLVPIGNKPLPEPMLTQISLATRRH